MTALEYMKRQVEKGYRNLESASRRPGVTEQELENIRLKIGYYEAAVKALKKEMEE